MFYSHEILTSRKYGVATIWLVATLGQKAGVKKITRKDILSVNVPKAVETIIKPDAPLALRLQGNLLYGVSKVYSQQCGYVLADAQSAQNNLRTMMTTAQMVNLDKDNPRARPEDLVLRAENATLPDMLFPGMALDLGMDMLSQDPEAFKWVGEEDSAYRRSQNSLSQSVSDDMLGGMGFHSDDTDSFRKSSGLGPLDVGAADADMGILAGGDDLVFAGDIFVDEEGNLVERPEGFTMAGALPVPQTPANATARARMMSEGASSQVRREHDSARNEAAGHLMDADMMDIDLPRLDDHLPLLSDLSTQDVTRYGPETQTFIDIDNSEHSAGQQRMRRSRKILALDEEIEIRKSLIRRGEQNYVSNMLAANREHLNRKLPAQARKNAEHWILGKGLNGIGSNFASFGLDLTPLSMFVGDKLYEFISGHKIENAKRGRKRKGDSSDTDSTTDSIRRVRARAGDDVELPRVGEDGFVFQQDDVELARERGSAIGDISSAMPWNISASIRGSSLPPRAVGSSARAPVGSAALSRSAAAARLVSASPLTGRGTAAPLRDDDGFNFQVVDDGYMPLAEGSGGESSPMKALHLPGDNDENISSSAIERSAHLRALLDQDSREFLGFVQEAILHKQDRDELASQLDVAAVTTDDDSVSFEKLLEPVKHPRSVAARGFLHVLALASKSLVKVRQDRNEGDYAPMMITAVVQHR